MAKREAIPLHDPNPDRKCAPIISPLSQIELESNQSQQQIPGIDSAAPVDPAQSSEAKSSTRPFHLNYRFLIVFLVLMVLASTGGYFLHQYQVHSMANVFLDLAKQAESNGEDVLAKSHYKNYLRLMPGDRETLESYSLLYYRTAKTPRDRVRAVSILENLLRKNENRDDFRKIILDAYIEFGRQHAPQYRGALRHIDYFLEKSPDDLEFVELRAECRWKLGDIDEAIADYRSLLRASPLRFEFYARLAHLYRFELDDIKNSDRTMDEMVKANPQAWKAYLLRARYHRKHMKLRNAALDVRRAWQLNKTEPSVLLLAVEMSISTRGLANFSNVIELSVLRELLSEIEPNRDNEIEIALAIANLDLIDDRPGEALNRIAGIADKYPQNMSLKRSLCELQIRLGKFDEAEKLISQLASDSESSTYDRFYKAWLLFERKRYLEAIRLLNRLTTEAQQHSSQASKISILLSMCYGRIGWELHQNYALNSALQTGDLGYFDLFRIATGFESLGKFERAQLLYGKFQQNATIAEKMAQTEIRKIRLRPSALQDWTRADSLVSALSQFPEKKEIAVRFRAEILAAQNKNAEGLSFVEIELKKQPDSSQLVLTLVELLIREKRYSEARTHLDKLRTSSGPTFELLAAEIFFCSMNSSEESLELLHSLEHEIGAMKKDLRIGEVESYRLETNLAHAFDRKNKLNLSMKIWNRLSLRYPQDVSLALSCLDIARRIEDLNAVKSIAERLYKMDEARNPYFGLAKAVEAIIEAKTTGKTQVLNQAIDLLKSEELQSYRNSRQFLLALARLYEAQNRIEDAIRYYEITIESGDYRADVFRHLIELLHRRGKFRLAETYLEKLTKESPESISGNFGRLAADISLRLREHGKALEIAKQVVLRSPEEFRHRLWLAQILAVAGEDRQAEDEFQKTIAMASSRPEPWVGYIFYLMRQSRKQEATATIKEAFLKIDSGFRDLAIAQCYEQIGDFAQAESHYRISFHKYPSDANVKTTFADFYYRQGEFAKAETLIDSLIATESNYAKIARRQKALILIARDGFRELEHALELVEHNLSSNPDSVIDNLLTASILSKHPAASRRKSAINILESVRRRQTLNSENRFLLAQLHLSLGNWEKSRELLQYVVATEQFHPTYLTTYIEQMILHREKNGQLESALIRLKTVREDSPNTAYLEMMSLATQNRIDEALKVLAERWPAGTGDEKQLAKALWQKAEICADLTQGLNAIGYAVFAQRFSILADGFYQKTIDLDRTKTIDYARFLKSQFDVTTALQLCENNFEDCSPDELAAVVIELLRAKPDDPANFRLAEKIIDRLTKENPESSLVTFQLANLRHLQGRFSEAIGYYRKTLEKIPGSIVALNELAMLLSFEGKSPQEAARRIEQAIRLAGPQANLLDTRGMIYFAAGEFKAAEKDLMQAIDQAPSAVKHYHLAQIKAAMKLRADAKIALRKGLSLGLQSNRLHPLERKNFPEFVRLLNK